NDLEDVGFDTYHHTFFEMLGNWSFGDYFKKEAIEWAWELAVKTWKFSPARLYATVYSPDKEQNDPGDFDQEAHDHWARLFKGAGVDPKIHIVRGGKKDNFWMMGETGPCGPCSELHVDLTPKGDSEGALVNKGRAECMEIWNLVFIQFNANADGGFTDLPARHVDTGMGFERVTAIMQCTKGLTDFAHAKISNYETDIFRPIFHALEEISGKKYGGTLPPPSGSIERGTDQRQIACDIAFRVIADHIRTLSFAIADGIQPSNEGRGYVLRRILRRAVRYGRSLGLHEPFFYKLVDVPAQTMGDVFPEIRTRKKEVQRVIRAEEEAFNKTLDNGIELFNEEARATRNKKEIPGDFAFKLYDTYGFPLDLTELMARERGLTVDKEGFERLMEEQRTRGRAAQKKTIIEVSQIASRAPTRFVGYDELETAATVLEAANIKDKTAVVLDVSPMYAEMGGQVGDTGELKDGSHHWRVLNTQKSGNTWLHFISAKGTDNSPGAPAAGARVTLAVDKDR
ncbi:MAG: alanine--tRNA ligase, partial [Verrucomicrobia bacterium]|nr:alanine--tRNA ligase [Verrucomicrobiota bacterium]